MARILALAGKDLRLLSRDLAGAFFVFVFPLLTSIFFGYIFSSSGGSGGGIEIAIVDEDVTPESERFVATLQRADEFVVQQTDRETARALVRTGDIAAYVVLPKGFGEARERMFWGAGARLQLGLDPSRKAEAGLIQGVLSKHLFDRFSTMFSSPDLMHDQLQKSREQLAASADAPAVLKLALGQFFDSLDGMLKSMPPPAQGDDLAAGGWQPASIEIEQVSRERLGPANAFEISFPQGMMWGILGCSASFGISLVIERTEGTLVRLQMSPLSRLQILAGKGLACFTATLGITLVLTAIASIFFGVRVVSPWLYATALMCVAFCFTGIMMLLSLAGKSERSAAGAGWAVLLVMSMIGGGALPLAFMPPPMQAISDISPVKWSILAIEGAIWRGLTPLEMLKPLGILLCLGLGSMFAAAKAFRWG